MLGGGAFPGVIQLVVDDEFPRETNRSAGGDDLGHQLHVHSSDHLDRGTLNDLELLDATTFRVLLDVVHGPQDRHVVKGNVPVAPRQDDDGPRLLALTPGCGQQRHPERNEKHPHFHFDTP